MAQDPRKIARSVHEAARDEARAIAKTEAYAKDGHQPPMAPQGTGGLEAEGRDRGPRSGPRY